MAFTRMCLITLVITLSLCSNLEAQTVYYPAWSSSVLKASAKDAAELLGNSINGTALPVQEYTVMPAAGIIFVYDSTITDNQLCKAESNGTSILKFTAAQDNGLIFGLYQYLEELGYKFYQPGSVWQITPMLNSAFRSVNKTYNCSYRYKTWFISGGHNRWVMDNDNSYGWDTYYGQNGHNWALYQRRNGMLGSARFTGHRGDIMSGNYFSALQQNPCYVACYNGSRVAMPQSVPDVNNNAAMQLWGNTIEQKYTSFKNTIFGNKTLYADYYRNFDFNYGAIGIEVPDGSQWGNSKDNSGCSSRDYESASNQNITLANFSVQQMSAAYPTKRFQLYAYSSHADIPAPGIAINNKIDIQVVPAAFQNESSAKGLLNRWYNRFGNISEYQYMNIPQWGGETPMFYLDDLKTTLKRLKEKNSQGVLWEASPAKFASIPFLWAANKNLLAKKDVDSLLLEFCNNMFGPAAATINKLLHQWSDDNCVTMGDFMQDNKYKIPLYFQLLNTAVLQAQQSPDVVKQRLRELKAYLHYMVLYYDWLFDQRSNTAKADKAAALCIYLARINRLQLVNSYFIIADIVSRYSSTDPFYAAYNVSTGSAYMNGALPLITDEEIDTDFTADLSKSATIIPVYDLADQSFIVEKISNSNITAAEKITVKIGYTNGANYPNRAEYYIHAQKAGSFTINYIPRFNMETGNINFTVEDLHEGLGVIKDFSLTPASPDGSLTVDIPGAGTYKLSVVSKYQSSVDLQIICNGNYFYKNTAFLGNKTENYRTDLNSLPGYFYVPAGIQKIYFSVNNSNPGGTGFASAAEINKAFIFRDAYGNKVDAQLSSAGDSALFFLDIPPAQTAMFWQVFKMEQYNLCFANISNMLLYATRKACPDIDIRISVNEKNCSTHLSAITAPAAAVKWEIYDNGRWMYYDDEKEIDLPDYTSPNAVVNLFSGTNCSTSKRLADTPGYYQEKQACASGAPIPVPESTLMIYPNPSAGVFNLYSNGIRQYVDETIVFNAQGAVLLHIKNNNLVNLSFQPSGIYLYKISLNGRTYTGKLLKL